ncbi:CPBP family intramembrane glutamic endopeptidase [Engelhardtia mirabilis]|uniref:CPBP family intramembrane glutamic endopeptidase n=1 Tax=Engelhardtia mirabilis TaxID=2528011 RepID=UPI003AF385E4
MLGPVAGAILAWRHRAGAAGLRALWRHLVDVRISDWRGWTGALLPAGYFAVASTVVFALTGVTFRSEVGPLGFAGLLLASCVLVIGEELGWRGTQLPLLQETGGALRSSVVVAVSWAFWHLPLVLMWGAGPDSSPLEAGLALIPYLLLTIPMAVMHTFAFNSARGLVLVSVVLHGLHNHLNAVLGPNPAEDAALARAGALSGPVLMGVFWSVAVGLWIAFRGRDLAPRGKVTASSMLESRP